MCATETGNKYVQFIPTLQHYKCRNPRFNAFGTRAFEFKDRYFLKFVVRPDDKTLEKIKTICAPFDHKIAVIQAISESNNYRLFLLVGPDTFQKDFKDNDDLPAFALCKDALQRTQIHYFEVNYDFRHSYEPNQKYRRVGTSTLDALKEVYKNHELYGRRRIATISVSKYEH